MDSQEKKTREFIFSIQDVKSRIGFLALLAFLGGGNVLSFLFPGVRSDDVHKIGDRLTVIELQVEQLSDGQVQCEDYRRRDGSAMENIRSRTTKLELLIDQCLEKIR